MELIEIDKPIAIKGDIFGRGLYNGDLVVESGYRIFPAIVLNISDYYVSLVYLDKRNIKRINDNMAVSVRNISMRKEDNNCKQVMKINVFDLSKEYKEMYDVIYKRVKQIE